MYYNGDEITYYEDIFYGHPIDFIEQYGLK